MTSNPFGSITAYPIVRSTSSQFSATPQPLGAAGDVWFAYQQVWDYYLNVHGRRGWDGNGATNNLLVGYAVQNAYFVSSDKSLRFGTTTGDINGMPLTTMDTVGHEFTHGVTFGTAGLASVNEPGALNESFSDIFGTATEFYSKRLTTTSTPALSPIYMSGRPSANFLYGEETNASNFIRSLADPPSQVYVGQNGTYAGVDDYNKRIPVGGFDNGGVHFNCGIQSKVFYLLSVGGTHYGITVSSIGRDKAEKIFYRALTTKLSSNSIFYDARRGSISAAQDLYGVGSFEANQVSLAWDSVHVP